MLTWNFLEGSKRSLSHQGHWEQSCLLPDVTERRRPWQEGQSDGLREAGREGVSSKQWAWEHGWWHSYAAGRKEEQEKEQICEGTWVLRNTKSVKFRGS